MTDLIQQILCGGTILTDALIAGLGVLALTGITTNMKILGVLPLMYGGAGLLAKMSGYCGQEFINNPWSKS